MKYALIPLPLQLALLIFLAPGWSGMPPVRGTTACQAATTDNSTHELDRSKW